MNKKALGLILILMWVSINPLLYPFPLQNLEQYKSYMIEQEDIYLSTFDEEKKRDYLSNKDRAEKMHLKKKEFVIFVIWILKLIWISLGILAGWLLYKNKKFLSIMVPTSAIYLIVAGLEIGDYIFPMDRYSNSLLESYINFLFVGVLYIDYYIPASLFFLNQYLILPILHIIFLVKFLILKKD